jgi:hypothetical protein
LPDRFGDVRVGVWVGGQARRGTMFRRHFLSPA